MVFFKFMDEAIQTSIVVISSIVFIVILYLIYSRSPKILGILLSVAGVLIFVYFPHMESHQTPRFTRAFKYIGIILFLIGMLLIL